MRDFEPIEFSKELKREMREGPPTRGVCFGVAIGAFLWAVMIAAGWMVFG